MGKVSAELRQAFRALLDQILNSEDARSDHAKDRRSHLDTVLGVLAANNVNLREVLKILKGAWHENRRALDERQKIAEERKRYQKQQRGQRLLAKGTPLLRESLPPNDPNRPVVDMITNSTLSVSSASFSPPLGLIKLPHVGNPRMPWTAKAREGLRQAGVSEEEVREELLSIFGLKRKQEPR